jgi:hypothetical protein
LPSVASVLPPALTIAIAAPIAPAPIAPAIASVFTLRFSTAFTVTPPPARRILAPLSTCAFCVASASSTTIWPLTPTKPMPTPNAVACVVAAPPDAFVVVASTRIVSETVAPALSEPVPVTPASACVSTLRTTTETPTPTRPPAIVPPSASMSRLSRATILMLPPTSIVPATVAEVPSGKGREPPVAVPAGVVGAPAAIFVFAWPMPPPSRFEMTASVPVADPDVVPPSAFL